ncbi:MAG: RCC1 domain-containing protein [Candidatus Nanopelagicales bacterium]
MRVLHLSGRAAMFAAVAMVWASLGAAPQVAVASAPVQTASLTARSVGHAEAATAGFVHSCVLTTKGAVKCWGYNGEGELGNNTKVNSAKPVAVHGLSKGVKSISAGSYFTCALKKKGAVKCWGSNTYGQLGNNTTTDSVKPVQVYGLGKGVKAISSGNFFACALTTKGAVKCWGANTYGQLGNGTTKSSAKPVAVRGFTKGGKGLGAGGYHACAVTSKRAAKCWGYNGEGELGNNTKVNSAKPVAVYGLHKGVGSLSAGSYSTCALTTKGAVKCWGYNGDGELGNNTTTSALKPVAAYGLTKKVKAIAYGDIHGCALTTAGRVKCWGYNGYGALGDNTTTSSPKPVGVYNMGPKIKGIAAGGYHSCAVTTKGRVKCWGFNAYGQLGNGTLITSHKPVGVFGLS